MVPKFDYCNAHQRVTWLNTQQAAACHFALFVSKQWPRGIDLQPPTATPTNTSCMRESFAVIYPVSVSFYTPSSRYLFVLLVVNSCLFIEIAVISVLFVISHAIACHNICSEVGGFEMCAGILGVPRRNPDYWNANNLSVTKQKAPSKYSAHNRFYANNKFATRHDMRLVCHLAPSKCRIISVV